MALDVQHCRADLDELRGEWAELAGLRREPDFLPRSRLDRKGLAGVATPNEQSAFLRAEQSAGRIIQALRLEFDQAVSATAPFTDARIDPASSDHVRGLIDAHDWGKCRLRRSQVAQLSRSPVVR